MHNGDSGWEGAGGEKKKKPEEREKGGGGGTKHKYRSTVRSTLKKKGNIPYRKYQSMNRRTELAHSTTRSQELNVNNQL